MKLDFSVYNFIILLGGIQGIILSLVLFFSAKEERKANKFLSLLVFIMSLLNLDLFADDANLYTFYKLPFSVPFLHLGVGPSLYFYTICLINPAYKLSKKDLLHFLPVIIECFYYLSTVLWMTRAGLEFHYWWIDPVESYSSMLALVAYIFMSNRTLKFHQLKKIEKTDDILGKQLTLLRWFLLSMIIILVLWFSLYVYYDYRFKFMNYTSPGSDLEEFFPVLLALTLVIYIIGFSSYFRREARPMKAEVESRAGTENPFNHKNPEELSKYIDRIMTVMHQEKLYLNPDLSLTILSKHLELNPKYLSYILNSEMNSKFYDFVNEFRVEEVKKRLLDAEYKNLTIIAIAFDSGFNSKAAFNRIFKNFTNMSPKKYKDIHFSG